MKGKRRQSRIALGGPPSGTTREDSQAIPAPIVPPSQGAHPADSGDMGGSDFLRTFLASGGTECLSFKGGLAWTGFWVCLLQARGFAGSPNDLQNSTCMGEKG